MSNTPGFAWNIETEARLRQLVTEPHSARSIAALLGCTRNALISKCDRLKLALPMSRGYPPRSRKPKPATTNVATRFAKFLPDANVPLEDTALRDSPAATPLHIEIADLTSDNCHWPYGEGPFSFCGCIAQENSPYCKPHHSLAHKVMHGR